MLKMPLKELSRWKSKRPLRKKMTSKSRTENNKLKKKENLSNKESKDNKKKLRHIFAKEKESVEEKLVKICPRCGSTNISSGYNALNGVVKDYCGDCGFNKQESIIAEFPQMTEKEAKKLKEKLNKINKI